MLDTVFRFMTFLWTVAVAVIQIQRCPRCRITLWTNCGRSQSVQPAVRPPARHATGQDRCTARCCWYRLDRRLESSLYPRLQASLRRCNDNLFHFTIRGTLVLASTATGSLSPGCSWGGRSMPPPPRTAGPHSDTCLKTVVSHTGGVATREGGC
jgi:hypothetical protein